MTVAPLWVSSPEHLKQFTTIRAEASWWRRLIGAYRIPAGFPHVEVWWGLLPIKAPMVIFAQGALTLDGARLRFEPTRQPRWMQVLGTRWRNLDGRFVMDLAREDIESIEPFTVPEAFLRYFTPPWVRIRALRGPPGGRELLLAVGSNLLPVGSLRGRNARFASVLREWRYGSGG